MEVLFQRNLKKSWNDYNKTMFQSDYFSFWRDIQYYVFKGIGIHALFGSLDPNVSLCSYLTESRRLPIKNTNLKSNFTFTQKCLIHIFAWFKVQVYDCRASSIKCNLYFTCVRRCNVIYCVITSFKKGW